MRYYLVFSGPLKEVMDYWEIGQMGQMSTFNVHSYSSTRVFLSPQIVANECFQLFEFSIIIMLPVVILVVMAFNLFVAPGFAQHRTGFCLAKVVRRSVA